MNKITLQTDEVRDRMYEVGCLLKCLYKTFQTSIKHKKDSTYLLPLTKITYEKFNNLSTNFEELEDKIYRKALS